MFTRFIFLIYFFFQKYLCNYILYINIKFIIIPWNIFKNYTDPTII